MYYIYYIYYYICIYVYIYLYNLDIRVYKIIIHLIANFLF